MIRTSLTHPLRIDAIDCGKSRIGMTLCPGKRGKSTFGGAWARDLKADIAALSNWEADLVITLMPSTELAKSCVPTLGAAVAAAGMEWLHLPIPDMGAPDAGWEARWRDAGPGVRSLLRCRGRVLIHCRGGLGRTGVLAAKLLVEFGVSPREAVQRVRSARHGAIETSAQMGYVMASPS